MDVDIASESTALAKYSILVQASASMLAQANQSANIALSLLGQTQP
jgi:flagellin